MAVNTSPLCLSSGAPALDRFLDGGLPFGSLSEWGLPLGFGTRRVILQFLAAATHAAPEHAPLPVLWVSSCTALHVFPPTWAAYGVDLQHIGFVRTDHPVRDLKPVFLDAYYRIVVLDMPTHLSRADFAFLAHRARANASIIMVLHNRFLTAEQGNVWARLRINGQRHETQPHGIRLTVVRGLSPRTCVLTTLRLEQAS